MGSPSITLKSTWEELTTRDRWLTWLGLAKEESLEMYDWWHTDEGCLGCVHFDSDGTWCNLVELPASRNPYLNMLGMACCGAGYDTGVPQLELSLTGVPF